MSNVLQVLIHWLHLSFKVCTCMNFTIIHNVGVNSHIKSIKQYELFMIDTTKRMMSDVNVVKKDGICRIIVHNINKIPSPSRFRGLPDPYVNVFYHGTFFLV